MTSERLADLVIDTAEIDGAAAAIRHCAEAISRIVASGGSHAMAQAAEAIGHERLALHVRMLAERAGARDVALARNVREVEISLVTISQAMVDAERITAEQILPPHGAESRS
jgi:hypothetical protein